MQALASAPQAQSQRDTRRGIAEAIAAATARARHRRPAAGPAPAPGPPAESPGVPLTYTASPGRPPLRVSAAPRGTKPEICTVTHSLPAVVSPPTSATSCWRARASKPALNSASHASSAPAAPAPAAPRPAARPWPRDPRVHGQGAMTDRVRRRAWGSAPPRPANRWRRPARSPAGTRSTRRVIADAQHHIPRAAHRSD